MADQPELVTPSGGDRIAGRQNFLAARPRGPLLAVALEIVPRARRGAVKWAGLAVNS